MNLKTIFSSVSKTVFETMAKIHCVVPHTYTWQSLNLGCLPEGKCNSQ